MGSFDALNGVQSWIVPRATHHSDPAGSIGTAAAELVVGGFEGVLVYEEEEGVGVVGEDGDANVNETLGRC